MNLLVNRLKQYFIFLFFIFVLLNVNDGKADSHDDLTQDLKQALSKVINENFSKDLQQAIATYASVISQKLNEDEKEDEKNQLLQSTEEILRISSNGNINDFNQLYTLLNNLEKIIDIIYPYILNEMSKQNIENDLQIKAWLAFSDLKTGIANFDESQIKNSLQVISKALVAESITEAKQDVAENETETENGQNNGSKIANYDVDSEQEVMGKVQKTGAKGFFEDDTQLKKNNKVSTNKVLTCRESSRGCIFILDKNTSFYLKNATKIIINSYFVDEDGTQFIKACLLEGGFYFKTLRKTNSQVTINIKNNGMDYYDAITSKGFDAKLGVLKENNIDIVNAGGTKVSKFRFYSENAAMKLDNVNISNIEDVKNMFDEMPLNDILPSITNSNGDPCINPNFGDISIKVQQINTDTCTHNHFHDENGDEHTDDYDEGNYDFGDSCNADIVIPNVICPNYSCVLNPPSPDDPNPNPGEDHHSG